MSSLAAKFALEQHDYIQLNNMSNNPIPRYSHAYRATELTLIMRCAQQGQSLGLVGMAGSGKSNIVNLLGVDPYGYKAHYLNGAVDRVHFPVVDARTWLQTPASLWQLMLDALVHAVPGLVDAETVSRGPGSKVIALEEARRSYNKLQSQLAWLCQAQGHKVMFVLDDFDAVLQVGPAAMLEQFSALRNAGNRGLLSYLVLTKRLPHRLGVEHDLEHNSKFYNLFRHQLYPLGLYTDEDSWQMLRHLNATANNPLSRDELLEIRALGGGHAALTRAIFGCWVAERPPPDRIAVHLAANQEIEEVCRQLLAGLHEHEQAVARRLAANEQTPDDQPAIEHLHRRGLVKQVTPPFWFSPIIEVILNK